MTSRKIEKILDELHDIDVDDLTGRARDLFYAIMKIADERDELLGKNKELQQALIDIRELVSGWLEFERHWAGGDHLIDEDNARDILQIIDKAFGDKKQ